MLKIYLNVLHSLLNDNLFQETSKEEYTPKLFSDDQTKDEAETNIDEENVSKQLFDQDNDEEEDFEIPAFLRRQKF